MFWLLQQYALKDIVPIVILIKLTTEFVRVVIDNSKFMITLST